MTTCIRQGRGVRVCGRRKRRNRFLRGFGRRQQAVKCRVRPPCFTIVAAMGKIWKATWWRTLSHLRFREHDRRGDGSITWALNFQPQPSKNWTASSPVHDQASRPASGALPGPEGIRLCQCGSHGVRGRNRGREPTRVYEVAPSTRCTTSTGWEVLHPGLHQYLLRAPGRHGSLRVPLQEAGHCRRPDDQGRPLQPGEGGVSGRLRNAPMMQVTTTIMRISPGQSGRDLKEHDVTPGSGVTERPWQMTIQNSEPKLGKTRFQKLETYLQSADMSGQKALTMEPRLWRKPCSMPACAGEAVRDSPQAGNGSSCPRTTGPDTFA